MRIAESNGMVRLYCTLPTSEPRSARLCETSHVPGSSARVSLRAMGGFKGMTLTQALRKGLFLKPKQKGRVFLKWW